MENLKFVYFGGEPLGVPVLEELKKARLLPSLVVCNPDRPVGRKQILTPPPVKVWAQEHNIPVWQPESFKNQKEVTEKLKTFDLFVVVAYNKILPKWLIELPKYHTLNVHPSLLPLLRGASPIRSAILHDMRDQIGVTIIQLDEKMDHGPILAQETYSISKTEWPIRGSELDAALAELGGKLLAQTLPKWIAGEITLTEQFHNAATYCPKLERSMGELTIDPFHPPTGEDAYRALLKIRAFDGFPGTFFMYNGKRVKILDAELTDNTLNITRVIPEGKKEQSFQQFLQSHTPLDK